jgi:CheY-like chemotaxis protein
MDFLRKLLLPAPILNQEKSQANYLSATALEALEKVRTQDLILSGSDICMPDMDGHQSCAK